MSDQPASPLPVPVNSLASAERAFERGDWRSAKQLAREALGGAPDEQTAQAARELIDRFRNDCWLGLVFALATLFLVATVWSWWRH